MKEAVRQTAREQRWKLVIFIPAIVVVVMATFNLVQLVGERTTSTTNMWIAILSIAGGFIVECVWTFISGIHYNLYSEEEV